MRRVVPLAVLLLAAQAGVGSAPQAGGPPAGQQTTSAATPQAEALREMAAKIVSLQRLGLTVAAPVTAPSGDAAGAAAFVSGDTFSYFIHSATDACGIVSMSETEPATAGLGWRVSGEIVERTTAQLIVEVDWQREWEHGRRLTNGPRGSTRLTLARDTRVPLDYIPSSRPTAQCDRVGIGLDVTAERRLVAEASSPTTNVELDAELWLVRTKNGRELGVQHQRVRTQSGRAGFIFRPRRDSADTSTSTIELSGHIQTARQRDGTPGLFVGIDRLYRNPESTGVSPRGGSGRTIALPAPDDVTSFDLPSSSKPPGAARAGGGGGGRGAIAGGLTGRGTASAASGVATGPPSPDAPGTSLPPDFSLRLRVIPAAR